MKIVISENPVRLIDLPKGNLFLHGNNTIVLKTEYYRSNGYIECFIVGTGEFYYGGYNDIKEFNNHLVYQVTIDNIPDKIITKDRSYDVIKDFFNNYKDVISVFIYNHSICIFIKKDSDKNRSKIIYFINEIEISLSTEFYLTFLTSEFQLNHSLDNLKGYTKIK